MVCGSRQVTSVDSSKWWNCMPHASPSLSVRIKGPLAVFTDPVLKVERVSVP